MNIFSDPVNIAAMVVAALVGFKLWRVLGQSEAPPQPLPQRAEELQPLPTDLEVKAVEVPQRVVWEGITDRESALGKGLQHIADRDADFDTNRFMAKAREAHEMILNSFAAGETKKLEPLLAKNTFDIFAREIERRKAAGENAVFKFIRLAKSELKAAKIEGSQALIDLNFTSEIVSAIKDAKNHIISGDAKAIAKITELWTFGCDLSQSPRQWRLIETHE